LPQYHVVTDPDDPAVAPFRAIKERDLVGREGLFIAEGETVLRAFVRDAPERVVSLLIDPKRRDKLADVFDGLAREHARPPRRPSGGRLHRRLPPASRRAGRGAQA
jgi:hypothetical protein